MCLVENQFTHLVIYAAAVHVDASVGATAAAVAVVAASPNDFSIAAVSNVAGTPVTNFVFAVGAAAAAVVVTVLAAAAADTTIAAGNVAAQNTVATVACINVASSDAGANTDVTT